MSSPHGRRGADKRRCGWAATGRSKGCATHARLVRPDAVLEVVRPDNEDSRLLSVEYDRTRRVDKNFEKFRRYDTLLCWWWSMTPLRIVTSRPT